MSDPVPAPAEHQFKVKLDDGVLLALHNQANALGFHTENALAAVGLKTLSKVPANKLWEVFALIERYHPGVSGRRRK